MPSLQIERATVQEPLLPSYTLTQLLDAISRSASFESAFRYLPRGANMESQIWDYVSSEGQTVQERRLLVGHTNLLSAPPGSSRRRVWAFMIPEASTPAMHDSTVHVAFSLFDGTPVSTNCSSVTLIEPFKEVNKQQRTAWEEGISDVVVFYFLEKFWLESITMTQERLRDFETACFIVACKARREQKQAQRNAITWSSPAQNPSRARISVERSEQQASIVRMPVHSRLPSIEAGSSSQNGNLERDGNDGGSLKRAREDDDFVEYQSFVHRLRRKANTDNEALKADIEQLRERNSLLEANDKDAEKKLEVEGVKTVHLKSEISKLRCQNKYVKQRLEESVTINQELARVEELQKQKVKELEDEMQELRDFRQKVRGLF